MGLMTNGSKELQAIGEGNLGWHDAEDAKAQIPISVQRLDSIEGAGCDVRDVNDMLPSERQQFDFSEHPFHADDEQGQQELAQEQLHKKQEDDDCILARSMSFKVF